MKQLLLLFQAKAFIILMCCGLAYPQTIFAQSLPKQPVKCTVVPGSVWPKHNLHHGNGNMKNLGIRDTSDILDYSTYNEVIANDLNISFHGSWNGPSPSPYAVELTSFLTFSNAMNGFYTFAQVAFDSLAFSNYTNLSTYSIPRQITSTSLDSLGMFIGISGDTTVADGKMAHDSLVINIYKITGNTISAAPIKTIVNAGYAGLLPFLTGTTNGELRYSQVMVGQQFNRGEGFAIKLTYLNKDTSSHCQLAYTYADSCQQVVYQGTTYLSPAYPSPFAHSSSYGAIDTANGGVIINVVDNGAIVPIPGLPSHCSYGYVQNWEFLPFVTVRSVYGTQIQPSTNTICNGASVNLSALVFGTDSPNITYHWSVNGNGILSDATSPNPTLTQLAGNTNNITVTLSVNDGSGVITDSLVLINCHVNVTLNGNQTVCTGSSIILSPSVTGGAPPFTYQWQSAGTQLLCANCLNPSTTITQNSVYTITVTDAAQVTATATVAYTVTGTTNTMHLTASNTNISCNSQFDTTTVNIAGGTSPFTANWGAGGVTSGPSPLVYNYGLPGGPQIITITDDNGCVSAIYDTVLNASPVINLNVATEPGCPNSATGAISVLVAGGTAPYHYGWSNGATTLNLSGIPSGQYAVTVSDANSCTAIFSYDLSSIQDFNYYVFTTSTNANCNLGGRVTTSVSGGVVPYTYNWSNGATTTTIHPITAGTYSVTITDSLGCLTTGQTSISNSCQSVITGKVFYDSLGNCNATGNTGLANISMTAISQQGNYYYGYTDANGNYSISVGDAGNYSLNFNSYNYQTCGNYTLCGNPNNLISLPVLGDTSNNNNISFASASGFNLGIHPGWTSANPGFTKQYWVFYYNSSLTPYNGPATITLNYDSNLVYQSSDEQPQPVNDAATHTLTWSVNNIPNQYEWNRLDGNFQVPVTLSLSYLLKTDFRITPTTGDCDSFDNHYHYTEMVTGSHDPNEKTVEPAGPITASDSVLTYTIHFQNTGTDSTHFVIIKDTLSANLDPATVRNIASSDKYSDFSISGKGILTWTFNPLRIVDSMTNPSGSKRFISFTVKKKSNLAIGSTISNKASIYFDYNDAVVTNTVADTESLPTYIFEVNKNSTVNVKAFPNPFSDITNIIVTGINEKFSFELYDVTGRLQQGLSSVNNNQFEVYKGTLAKGIYLYSIIVTNKTVAYGKLVVE